MPEMEFQFPPSKIARLADSRTELGSGCSMERNVSINEVASGSPSIGLGLELGHGGGSGSGSGSGSGPGPTISSGLTKSYGFTESQVQELQLQFLIYKYMEARLPIPYHLVFPIWDSVVRSLGGLNSRLHQLCPSFAYSPLFLEYYRNGMDPEPGRCRRTDGKKWRCSKEALPDQKYCERHVHRGRQRSRKLVEATASQSDSATTTNTNLSISLPH